jgi:diguanylate cyclase (GGDEF)-like protein/PAS domain S-box-containing protein
LEKAMNAPLLPGFSEVLEPRTALQKVLFRLWTRAIAWRLGAPLWQQLLAAVLLVLTGAAVRQSLWVLGAQLNYLPLLPSVTVAALILRWPVGATVVALTALLIHFVFVPLAGPGHDIAQVIYVLATGFTIGAAELSIRAQAIAIAEHRRAEAIERLNAAVVEFSKDAIIAITVEGIVTTWNPAATRSLGRQPGEIIGKPIATVFGSAADAEVLRRLRGGEVVEDFHLVHRARDGGMLDFSVTISPILDRMGTRVGASIILRDISQSKHVFDALRSSEEQLRFAIEAAGAAPWQWDCVKDISECSDRFLLQHGLDLQKPCITLGEFLARVHPEDRADAEAAIRSMQRPEAPDYHIQYRTDPRGGGAKWIETFGRVERDATGAALKVSGMSFDVTERYEALERIAYLAHHDGLTGLPNRALFLDRLEGALTRVPRGQGCAVLLIDLDRFKDVNDTLGHPTGDLLLCEVASRLQAEVCDADTLARLGGDEFAIIMAEADQPRKTVALAERILAAIDLAFNLDGHHVTISASIGIAMAPCDGLSAKALVKAADLALYRAKADGSGCLRFFEPENDTRMQLRRALEADLRRAWAAGEFELFFQPIMDLRSRRVSCLEALLRWRHPERGLVQPDEFIPVAEDMGLIIELGEWVLARACAEATTWPGGPRVAVNLSPVQLAHRGLAAAVATELTRSGLAADRLELEITETVMMKETKATLAALDQLKALGVRIAMDDFGTGYSSLRNLQRFPFNKVKIDRAFTSGLGQSRQSEAIVRAVTGMCASLGMTSTAEGVETEGQLRALDREGCIEAQGFLFSKPVPAPEVPALLEKLGQAA